MSLYQCFLFWLPSYSCSKWELATLVYIWREPIPLATKVAWEPEEKTLGQTSLKIKINSHLSPVRNTIILKEKAKNTR
jgi:hypothetical protein